MKKIKIVIFSILLLSVTLVKISSAGQLPVVIEKDTVLTAANSPYYAESSVTVSENATLKIESGVVMQFSSGASLIIAGSCIAQGQNKNRIKFEPLTEGNYWGGIRGNGGSILLDYIELEQATIALNISQGSLELYNSAVSKISGSDCIHFNYIDTVIIKDNCFTGDKSLTKQDAIDCDYGGEGYVLIENNSFNDYSDDAVDIGNQSLNIQIKNNRIHNCASIGISIGEGSNAFVERNIVSNCYGGIESHNGAYITAVNNTFVNNKVGLFGYHNSDSGTPVSGGNAEIVNSIFSKCQTVAFSLVPSSNITARYCLCDTDSIPGEDNIFADPAFIDVDDMDFRLKPTSICINAGDPLSNQDPDGSTADIGAEYYFEEGGIVINEIYFKKNPEGASQFIELYNAGENICELSGYTLSHQINFTFPSGTTIEPQGYLILAEGASGFNNKGVSVLEWGQDSLSSSGILLLEDSTGQVIDFVEFQNEAPWPQQSEPFDHSIELSNFATNNAFGEAWSLSALAGGTPGQKNSVTEIENFGKGLILNEFKLFQNYPNPFNPKTIMTYSLPATGYVNLAIYNRLGQRVVTLVNNKQSAGLYSVEWDISKDNEIASGVYLCRLKAGNHVETMKMILLK
jgi:parallel beta-helix repeat protein